MKRRRSPLATERGTLLSRRRRDRRPIRQCTATHVKYLQPLHCKQPARGVREGNVRPTANGRRRGANRARVREHGVPPSPKCREPPLHNALRVRRDVLCPWAVRYCADGICSDSTQVSVTTNLASFLQHCVVRLPLWHGAFV